MIDSYADNCIVEITVKKKEMNENQIRFRY